MADWVGSLPIGASASFTKTVGEVDVTLFAGLTGDLHPVHIDEEMMRKTVYGRRLVHGVFVLGLMSTAGAKLTGSLPVPTVSIETSVMPLDAIRATLAAPRPGTLPSRPPPSVKPPPVMHAASSPPPPAVGEIGGPAQSGRSA